MKTQNIYNLIILDASGSMTRIYEQALTGVNETIATIRLAQEEHPALRQYLTLVSFSAGERFLNRIFTALPIEEVRDISREDYPLLGCTALYDAMGTTISELQQHIKHDDRVLVTVITDGYENASRTWSGKQVKSLVEELRQMGWTFTYIGADQDVERVAESIGVRHALKFACNPQATQMMFAQESQSRSAYYAKMNHCMATNTPTLSEDASFFEPKKEDGTSEPGNAASEPSNGTSKPSNAVPEPGNTTQSANGNGARRSFFDRLFGKNNA